MTFVPAAELLTTPVESEIVPPPVPLGALTPETPLTISPPVSGAIRTSWPGANPEIWFTPIVVAPALIVLVAVPHTHEAVPCTTPARTVIESVAPAVPSSAKNGPTVGRQAPASRMSRAIASRLAQGLLRLDAQRGLPDLLRLVGVVRDGPRERDARHEHRHEQLGQREAGLTR